MVQPLLLSKASERIVGLYLKIQTQTLKKKLTVRRRMLIRALLVLAQPVGRVQPGQHVVGRRVHAEPPGRLST